MLNLSFDSIMPSEIPNYSGNLIFTTKRDFPQKNEKLILDEEIFDHHPTVIQGKMIQRLNLHLNDESLIIGVDPGKRIGLSIFYYGKEIECSVYSSMETLVSHLIQILGGLRAKRKIVKIGNGNMGE